MDRSTLPAAVRPRHHALRACAPLPALRRALAVGASAGAVVAGLAAASAAAAPADFAAINPVTPLTAQSFAAPGSVDKPWVRINMPATATPAGLQAQLQELADAHIAGAEYGQGAFPDEQQLVAILTKANELGIEVSLSHGPTQNPVGYSINSDNARKSLFQGAATVAAGATFDGTLPAPTPANANTPTLVSVLAYRCAQTPCPTSGVVSLERDSVVDLTSQVTGRDRLGVLGGSTTGSLRWTAPSSPAGAEWQLIAFWSRGVFAQPDPFSSEGTDELIASMESGFSPQVKALLRANGGDIMYDSHSSDRGSPDEIWTNRMAAEFRARRGYDLTPNFAGLFYKAFKFSDGSDARVRNDLYAVRGDIWVEKHLEPLRAYVRTFGNVLRLQPEGERDVTLPINDAIQASWALDRPEHESLWGDIVDYYKPIASANHMTGNPWYSTECCAVLNKNYAESVQDMVIRMNRSFAGGITKLVYHVYPYRDSATATWPGYHNFGNAGFANAWGPRNPMWVDAPAFNDFIARNQQVLTQGQAKADVAVYMQNYLYPQYPNEPHIRHWPDTKLEEAGFTHDYLNPTLLDLPNATVTNGRLAADGPAYKAFVVDAQQYPARDPVKTSLPISVAQKLLRYARAGLPVVIVGTPPNQTPGNTPGSDSALRSLVAKLLEEENVRQVDNESDVPKALRQLGVEPAARPAAPSQALTVRRTDAATKTDYYFLYNQGVVEPAGEPMNLFDPAIGSALDRTFTFEGRGTPYRLDAWSGEATPIADYTSDGEHVTVRVRLATDSSTIIALSDDPSRFAKRAPAVHVVSTEADTAVAPDGDTLAVRAARAGSYATALSDGTTVRSEIGAAAGAIDLTDADWQLSAQDWQPANPFVTVGISAPETVRVPVEVDLDGLKPWTEIPQLRDTSGTGVYTTTVSLPAGWSAADGATLSLGEVFDTFTVRVNDRQVPADQISGDVDLAGLLRAGENTIEVRVATTLNNRLNAIDPNVTRRGFVQRYGLVGPVVLTPYKQAAVWTRPAAEQPRQPQQPQPPQQPGTPEQPRRPASPAKKPIKVALARSATVKRGAVRFLLRNGSAAKVTGTVTLRAKLGTRTVVLGSGKVSVAAGKRATLVVKLTRAARARLGRRAKVTATATYALKNATGATATRKARLTIRLR
ncbi:glycosyl hydrolase [Conexibacter stalactiti]|uniref:Glycosyl hydrolase n=1 Tax=Conexibacter stalactiti TaxID=1940611 RepID=A0ABU4HW63_9ACTN|nr:glycosyl hydrolase [Conexibacter stalactiti]MDW5597565.1 glycosyl hydrolase [Conexibacter stalactiti]MEC5038207.1 glycosyl hydrolase [Conexibacter stalactiti]